MAAAPVRCDHGNSPINEMRILGIETSCDETAAAVVADGTIILSSVVASQIEVHHRYGGVVPELASRKHLEAIVPVVQQALQEAGLKPEMLDAVAATQGPGLVGALLVGFSFAKAFAYAHKLPLLAMDHLEGHLYSALLTDPPPVFPFVALLASGGHTGIYYLKARGDYQLLGQTRDDAAGEAYDKVAKMLGLGYPGGAVIDRLAQQGDPQKIVFTRPYLDKERFDFSFSGIKTAVQRYIASNPEDWVAAHRADIAAGFQAAVVDVLVHKLIHAAKIKRCRHVAMVGGVAANQGLRDRLVEAADRKKLSLHIPPMDLCGDNAVMIAAAAHHYLGDQKSTFLQDDVYSRHRRTVCESV
jgi:N6-L-threonylcarbamoyladenine synthase